MAEAFELQLQASGHMDWDILEPTIELQTDGYNCGI